MLKQDFKMELLKFFKSYIFKIYPTFILVSCKSINICVLIVCYQLPYHDVLHSVVKYLNFVLYKYLKNANRDNFRHVSSLTLALMSKVSQLCGGCISKKNFVQNNSLLHWQPILCLQVM